MIDPSRRNGQQVEIQFEFDLVAGIGVDPADLRQARCPHCPLMIVVPSDAPPWHEHAQTPISIEANTIAGPPLKKEHPILGDS